VSQQLVKWGVLGCANFARDRAIPAMLLADNVEVTGVASRSLDKARAFADQFSIPKAYGSYEEMLADPEIEAVYNPLPNGLHAEWTIKTLEAGKHCLTEKPFAATVAEAQAVAETAERTGKLVMEAFMWRFHPMHRRVRDLARDGAIGDIRLVHSAFTFVLARGENVRYDPNMAGGGLMDVGVYCVSAARFLFESEPHHVICRADFDPQYDVDMLACGILEFDNGYATFDTGFTLPYRCEYEVVGETGRILVPNAFVPSEQPEIIIERDGKQDRETFPAPNQWSLEFAHLSHSILTGEPLDYDAGDAVNQQKVMNALLDAARSGQREAV
jgi:D-xylose 1-dehydrogenase (NADP+, D-xylono-1,5-lactone-forming)